MTDQPTADRNAAWFKADFLPSFSRTNSPNATERTASAAEYAAHHLGLISRSLERIATTLERLAPKS